LIAIIGGATHDTIRNIENISADYLRAFASPQFSP